VENPEGFGALRTPLLGCIFGKASLVFIMTDGGFPMRLIVAFSFLAFLWTNLASAVEVGFSSGKQFTSISLHGQVTVDCAGGTTAEYSCRDSALEPVSYDYFIGPEGITATDVSLSNLRPDGTRRDRSSAYSVSVGRSNEAFNLWISTPFQRPLLASGVNKVAYVMKNKGATVGQGSFVVNVGPGTARECPTTHYNSPDAADCQSQYSVCQRYFEQYQSCH
jgi:hypothetical protein